MTPQEKEKLEKMAEEYVYGFSDNWEPNEFDVPEAFKKGYLARDAELNEREKLLVDALKIIANQDFRGNRSPDAKIAFMALKDYGAAKEKE